MRSSFARVAWGLCTFVCLAGNAHAQATSAAPGGDARLHFDRGVSLLNVQNFEGALAEFERSYAISPRPSVLLNIGVALQSLHRYPEAARTMEHYLRDAGTLSPARRAEVQNGIDQMRALFAHVRVDAQPAGATVRVDGIVAGTAPLAEPVEVGPGRHQIEVELNGQTVARQDVTIASGEERSIRIVGVENASTASGAPSSSSPPPLIDRAARPTLAIRGLPAGATLSVDGRTVDAGQPIVLPAGVHGLDVQASGFVSWRGDISLGPDDARVVTAHLAREAGGMRPVIFAAGMAATVAAGLGAVVTGALTLSTRAEFLSLYHDDPQAADVAARGAGLRTATNVLLVATGVLAIGTTIVLTQTRFRRTESTVSLSVAGRPDAAMATVLVHF